MAEMRLSCAPLFSQNSSNLIFTVSFIADSIETCLYNADLPDMKRAINADGHMCIRLDEHLPVAGDVKIELSQKAKLMGKRKVLLRFWFNTFMVYHAAGSTRRVVTERYKNKLVRLEWLEMSLRKNEVDFAHKDKHNRVFPADFQVIFRTDFTREFSRPSHIFCCE